MKKKRLFLPEGDYIYFTDRLNLAEVYCVDRDTFTASHEARFLGGEDFVTAQPDEIMPNVFRLGITKSDKQYDHYDIVDGPMTFHLTRIKTLAPMTKGE